MEPVEAPIKPKELFIVHVIVEEVAAHQATGQTYVTFDGIGARFWVSSGIDLKSGDRVKLMFHKENKDASNP